MTELPARSNLAEVGVPQKNRGRGRRSPMLPVIAAPPFA